jgi:hypothetical protein
MDWGCYHRPLFAAAFSLDLENLASSLGTLEKIFQKNEKICKKTIGIREKMVYNKKEYGKVSEFRHRRNRLCRNSTANTAGFGLFTSAAAR